MIRVFPGEHNNYRVLSNSVGKASLKYVKSGCRIINYGTMQPGCLCKQNRKYEVKMDNTRIRKWMCECFDDMVKHHFTPYILSFHLY